VNTYKPTEPYQFKSCKHADQYMEILMFQNYSFLVWYLNFLKTNSSPDSIKSRLQIHLEWLIAQGENRPVTMLCPTCHQELITHFSIVSGHSGCSMSAGYSSCDDEYCKSKISAGLDTSTHILIWSPIKFSEIIKFRYKGEQNQFADMIKTACGIDREKNMTHQRAFEFFTQPARTTQPA